MYFFILLLFLFNIGCGPRSNPIYNQSSKLDEPDNHDQNEESENLHWDQLFFDDTTSKFLYTFYINYPSGLLKYRFFMDLHTLQVDAFEDNKEITPPRFNCLYIVSGFCSKFEITELLKSNC